MAGPMSLNDFKRLVRDYNCAVKKTTKEWEVIDNTDGMRVSGFATVSGRDVKPVYISIFLKMIKAKRATP